MTKFETIVAPWVDESKAISSGSQPGLRQSEERRSQITGVLPPLAVTGPEEDTPCVLLST